LEDLGVDWG